LPLLVEGRVEAGDSTRPGPDLRPRADAAATGRFL